MLLIHSINHSLFHLQQGHWLYAIGPVVCEGFLKWGGKSTFSFQLYWMLTVCGLRHMELYLSLHLRLLTTNKYYLYFYEYKCNVFKVNSTIQMFVFERSLSCSPSLHYLIINTVKIVILWNHDHLTVLYTVFLKYFLPAFSVSLSFRKHYNMLIYC